MPFLSNEGTGAAACRARPFAPTFFCCFIRQGYRREFNCVARMGNENDLCDWTGCGKRLYFAKNPELRPSVAKANIDLIDLIGTAKAVPLQN